MTHQRFWDILTNHLLMKSQAAQLSSIRKLQHNVMFFPICTYVQRNLLIESNSPKLPLFLNAPVKWYLTRL